jgi:hypothetical protein
MNKPDLIQMHLDILYKSVTFISSEKILTILEDYKTAKEEKRKEEEDRLMQQLLMKKSRGRQSNKKATTTTDQEMNDESKKPKDVSAPAKADVNKDWRKESLDKSKLLNKRQPIANQNHNSFSKDKAAPSLKKSPTNETVKPLEVKKATPIKPITESDQAMEGESSDLSSSVDPTNQKHSKRSKKIKRSSALRKILKNIRKQKK